MHLGCSKPLVLQRFLAWRPFFLQNQRPGCSKRGFPAHFWSRSIQNPRFQAFHVFLRGSKLHWAALPWVSRALRAQSCSEAAFPGAGPLVCPILWARESRTGSQHRWNLGLPGLEAQATSTGRTVGRAGDQGITHRLPAQVGPLASWQ